MVVLKAHEWTQRFLTGLREAQVDIDILRTGLERTGEAGMLESMLRSSVFSVAAFQAEHGYPTETVQASVEIAERTFNRNLRFLIGLAPHYGAIVGPLPESVMPTAPHSSP